jgi:hypothetical protein
LKRLLNRVPENQSGLTSRRAYPVVGFIATFVAALSLLWLTSAFAQFAMESYTATVIPAEGYSGGSARVTIQISSWTTDVEKQKLMDALKSGTPDAAVALLHSMNHGHINIEGQAGRDIAAAFSRKVDDGRKLTLILEHVLTLYEQNKGIKAIDYPYTIVRMKFDPLGKPLSGEVIPAAKIKATKDGLLDVETESRNSGTIIDIKRVD